MRCASVTLDTLYVRHRIFYVVEFNRGVYVCDTVYLQARLQNAGTVVERTVKLQ